MIPGIVISLVTFPGIIVHELAHQLFCRIFKVPVFKVVYFQMENPTGYVMHETPANKWHSVMISIGPFFVNSILGAIIALPAALPVFKFDTGTPIDFLLIYCHACFSQYRGCQCNLGYFNRKNHTYLAKNNRLSNCWHYLPGCNW